MRILTSKLAAIPAIGIALLAASPSLAKEPIDFIVSYPAAPGATLDRDYYVQSHLPLVQESWGDYGLEGCDAYFPSVQDAKYLVVAVCRFRDEDALQSAFDAPDTPKVMADIANFTTVEPERSVARNF